MRVEIYNYLYWIRVFCPLLLGVISGVIILKKKNFKIFLSLLEGGDTEKNIIKNYEVSYIYRREG
jgi:hypothetical protein